MGGKWRTPEQRLAAAEAQAARARTQIRKQERSSDLRRKILIGAMMLDQAQTPEASARLRQLIDRYLTRDIDRALFDLPPLQKAASVTETFEPEGSR